MLLPEFLPQDMTDLSLSFICINGNEIFGKFYNFSEKLILVNNKYNDMSITEKTKMGSKGEILPKKKLRELADIYPNDEVIIEASPGELRIRRILSVKDVLKLSRISKGTPDEIEKEILEEIEKQRSE